MRSLALFTAGAALVLLAGCSLSRPLTHPDVTSQLRAIEVSRIGEYTGQLMRHQLERNLHARPPRTIKAKYRLNAGPGGGFTLTDIATKTNIHQDSFSIVVSGGGVADYLASSAARSSGTERKIQIAADLVVTSLATFFAQWDEAAFRAANVLIDRKAINQPVATTLPPIPTFSSSLLAP